MIGAVLTDSNWKAMAASIREGNSLLWGEIMDASIDYNMNHSVVYTQKGVLLHLNTKDIIYLESQWRIIIVNTLTAKHQIYSAIYKEEEKLSNYGFIRTHQSYLVNVNYINKVAGNNIFLKNSTILPISRRYHKNIKTALLREG